MLQWAPHTLSEPPVNLSPVTSSCQLSRAIRALARPCAHLRFRLWKSCLSTVDCAKLVASDSSVGKISTSPAQEHSPKLWKTRHVQVRQDVTARPAVHNC